MADQPVTFEPTQYFKAVDPNNPTADTFDYEAFQKKVQDISAQTADVKVPETPNLDTGTGAKVARWIRESQPNFGRQDPRITAALTSYESQVEASKQRAGKAAAALELQGQQTADTMRRLEQLETNVEGQYATVAGQWSDAIEKADEYVKASRTRVSDVLSKLDSLTVDINEGRDFAKAHDMQASVQAVLGSLQTEGRGIAEKYGVESKEYQQHQQLKERSLATIQSNIHVGYQKLQEAQDQTILEATNEAMLQSHMYVNFNEQQHVKTMELAAQSSQAFSLQSTQMLLSIDQMRANQMENFANWIIQTPSFTVDTSPLIAVISDINAEKRAQALADAQIAKLNPPKSAGQRRYELQRSRGRG